MSELDEIKSTLTEQSNALKRIEVAIMGDEAMGTHGIVHQMKSHEEAIQDYKKNKNRIIGGSAVLGGILGTVTHWFSKHFG